MLRLTLLPFALATLIASGCTGSGAAGSGGGGAGGAGGATGGAGGTTGGSGGTGGAASGSGGTGGQGGGKSCNGTPEQWCGYDAYCDAPTGTCPGGGVAGVCRLAPDDCTGVAEEITCGCNGQVYVNACAANSEQVDVGSQSGCVAPADPFACGPVLCQHGTEYCEAINYHHHCKPLPQGCDAPDTMCNCLEPVFCMSAPGETACDKDANGDFFVTCVVTD